MVQGWTCSVTGIRYEKHHKHANCSCILVTNALCDHLQVLWYHQKMGPSILIGSQGRTRACIRARLPMRRGLQRALPIYGSMVRICQTVVFVKYQWLAVFTYFERSVSTIYGYVWMSIVPSSVSSCFIWMCRHVAACHIVYIDVVFYT